MLTTGTLLTTPEAGALEMNANTIYATPEAGNRGALCTEHICCLSSAYTLTSTTSEQKMFNATSNGALTLAIGTYFFESCFIVTGMSATSGNLTWDFQGAGTAVVGSICYFTNAIDNVSVGTAATDQASYQITAQTATQIATAGTATNLGAFCSGTFRVTTGGTIIPSVALITAAAASVVVGSYFRCHIVGDQNMATVGDWS